MSLKRKLSSISFWRPFIYISLFSVINKRGRTRAAGALHVVETPAWWRALSQKDKRTFYLEGITQVEFQELCGWWHFNWWLKPWKYKSTADTPALQDRCLTSREVQVGFQVLRLLMIFWFQGWYCIFTQKQTSQKQASKSDEEQWEILRRWVRKAASHSLVWGESTENGKAVTVNA